jgi:hypothetical protein
MMSGAALKGAAVGVAFALVGGAAIALAGSGVNGVFNLGVSNSVDAKTRLTGASPTAQLQVNNTNGAAGASGLAVSSVSSSPTGSFTNSSTGTGLSVNSTGGMGLVAQSGMAAKPALQGQNMAGGPAGAFVVNSGVSPFTVNSTAKVQNLNADRLDGLDSTGFLRNAAPLSLTGATAANGVITGTNTGGANGLQGETGAAGASGVYGQNDGAGFGVAGRANAPGGVGVYAESLGGGPALAIHTLGAAPMSVDSSAKVANLNADHVDGASIVSNRIVSSTLNDHIIQLPGFGDFNVVSCDHTNAVFQWSSGEPAAFVFWWDVLNPSDSFEGVANLITSNPRPHHFATVQLARDVGTSTSIATVTITTRAADCVFAAQAVVQPG